MAPGELLGLSGPVIPVRSQTLKGDQEVVGGVTLVPRNPRRPIQSLDRIAECDPGGESRRNFQRLAPGAACHVPDADPAQLPPVAQKPHTSGLDGLDFAFGLPWV